MSNNDTFSNENIQPADVEEVAAIFEGALRPEPVDVEARAIDDSTPLPEGTIIEEQVSSVRSWHGNFLSIDDIVVRLPNGRLAHRDVVRHPGAVAIIALTDDGKLVLVHQYRTALEQVTVEIPAGKIEPGEDPRAAAQRELEEETGYDANQMAYLGPIAVASGYSDEILHLFMAMGLTFVGAHPDGDEFVHVDLVDLNELVDQVLDGRIVESKTVTGILLCDAILRRMGAADMGSADSQGSVTS